MRSEETHRWHGALAPVSLGVRVVCGAPARHTVVASLSTACAPTVCVVGSRSRASHISPTAHKVHVPCGMCLRLPLCVLLDGSSPRLRPQKHTMACAYPCDRDLYTAWCVEDAHMGTRWPRRGSVRACEHPGLSLCTPCRRLGSTFCEPHTRRIYAALTNRLASALPLWHPALPGRL